MSEKITEEKILKQLSTVMDPELNQDLVSLGMIKDIQIIENDVNFTIELTTPCVPSKN